MENSKDIHTNCGMNKILKIIGSKWTVLIIHNLLEGTRRFGELQRLLPGISPKTLTQRLSELEQAGVLERKVFAEVPLHVEYSLTKKGLSLNEVFLKMVEWGQKA